MCMYMYAHAYTHTQCPPRPLSVECSTDSKALKHMDVSS